MMFNNNFDYFLNQYPPWRTHHSTMKKALFKKFL